MKSRYHLPGSIIFPEEVSGEERVRLQRVLLYAISRAIANAAGKGAEIVVATPEDQDARERFSPSRYHPESGAYSVPSYDNGGQPVDVQVQTEVPKPWTNERVLEHIRQTFGEYGPRGQTRFGVQTPWGTYIIGGSSGGRPELYTFSFHKLKRDTEGHWLPTDEISVLSPGRYRFQVVRKSQDKEPPHPFEAQITDLNGEIIRDKVWTKHEIGYTMIFDVPEPAILGGEGGGEGGGFAAPGGGSILPGKGTLVWYQCAPNWRTDQLTDPMYAGMGDDDLWRVFINLCKSRALQNLDLSERYIRDQLVPRFKGPGGSVTKLSTYSRHNIEHFQERLRLLRGLMYAHADLSKKIDVRNAELWPLISQPHPAQGQFLSPLGFGAPHTVQAYWPTYRDPAPQHRERVRQLREELEELQPQFVAVVRAITILLEEDPFLTNFVSGLRVDGHIDVGSPEDISAELADISDPLVVQRRIFESMDKILYRIHKAREFLCKNHERVLDVPMVYLSVLKDLEGIHPRFSEVALKRIKEYQKQEAWIEIGLSALGLVLFVGGLIVSLAGGPAGVAIFLAVSGTVLGGVQAMRSIDKAVFATNISEATVMRGQGMISVEAASDARFWATVDVIFVAVDVAGHGLKAVTTARALAKARSATAAVQLVEATEAFEETVEAANRLNFESLWQRAGPGRQLAVSGEDLQRLAASTGSTQLSGQIAEELVEKVTVNTREFLPLATKLKSNQGIDFVFVRRSMFEKVFGAVGHPSEAAQKLGQASKDQIRQLSNLLNRSRKGGDLVAVEVKFTSTGQSVEELLTLGSRAGNQFNLTWFVDPGRGILQAMDKIADPDVRATGKLLKEVIGESGQFMERLTRVGITVAPDGRYALTKLTEQIMNDAAASKALYNSGRYRFGYMYGLLRAEQTGNAAAAARYRALLSTMNAQIQALDEAVRRAKQAQELAQRLSSSLQRSQDAMADVARLASRPQTPGILQAMQAASATARAHMEFIKHTLPDAESECSNAQSFLNTTKQKIEQPATEMEAILDDLEKVNPGLREDIRQDMLRAGIQAN